MMCRRSGLSAVGSAVFVVVCASLFAAGCGSEPSSDPSCTPGETQQCFCPSGEEGAQVCKSDGSGFEPCNCGAADAGLDADDGESPEDGGTDTSEPEDTSEEEETGTGGCDDENACGGCQSLQAEPGESCGQCDGTWTCDGDNRVVCDGGAPNPCGGCQSLSNTPGDSCGSQKVYVCDGDNSTTCESNAKNACGGTGSLANQPGVQCGPCDGGTYVCDAPNATVCKGAGTKNICGGCTSLSGRPGSACEDGGVWTCDGDDAVQCSNTPDQTNVCGGSQSLTESPGRPCGPCDEGTWICDGTDSLTCYGETDLNNDPDNCGMCGNSCDLSNAYETCSSGTCDLRACEAGWGNCDGNFSNGCEKELNTVDNCGMCGLACAIDHANETCTNGTCQIDSCESGWDDCDGDPANGCETDLDTASNCGACGQVCSFANASATCNNQSCALDSCDSGYGDCDNDASNGCEQSLDTANHCGSCGRSCDLANATETCNSGTCAIQSCDSGWKDCDGNAKNGCEVDTTSSTLHCGSCGNACPTGQTCQNSQCVDVISPGAGTDSACVTTANDTAKCWGRNHAGQLGRGSSTRDPKKIPKTVSSNTKYVDVVSNATGDGGPAVHYCALGPNGEVDCWGDGGSGQLGHGIFSGSDVPVTVQGISTAGGIATGERHSCAYLSGGGVECWGYNSDGQLGDGSANDSATPVSVQNATDAVDIAVSRSSSCLVDSSGTVKCWGKLNGSKTATKRSGLKSMQRIAGSGNNFCGITSNNSVQCWESGNETDINISDVVRVDVGGTNNEFACAVKDAGSVYCWMLESANGTQDGYLGNGSASYPSLDTPVKVKNMSNAAEISAGNRHVCATEKDGTLSCWGRGTRWYRKGLEQNARPHDSTVPREVPHFAPLDTETTRCTDGMDNDGDGKTDCQDPDCATDLGSQTGIAVTTGDLNDGTLNYRRGSCDSYASYDGAEEVYRWTAPQGGTYTFTVDPQSNCDKLYVYVKDSCGGTEHSCGTGKPASTSYNFQNGEEVVVVVDNQRSSSSVQYSCPYNLNIQ